MNKLDNILSSFLDANGRFQPSVAGPGDGITSSEASKAKFVARLLNESKFNRVLVIVILLMFTVIFALGIYFALYYRDKPATMGTIFGGTFLSLLTIVYKLQQLWKEKSKIDYLLILIPNLSATDALKVVETLLYTGKSKEGN